jgi:uncharacterized protein
MLEPPMSQADTKWKWGRPLLRIAAIAGTGYAAAVALLYFQQRALLFHPTHETPATALAPWLEGRRLLGCCREVGNPEAIWLVLHGNAGQAAHRDYVLPCLPPQDSVYVLEYPGYGARAGAPGREAMNRAAAEGYQALRARYPQRPVCVLGESIGSGPACALAGENPPPDKIVLVVPFDVLAEVAARHFPFLPARRLLRDAWNNVDTLRDYRGPVEIFGAEQDDIIPIRHARALARAVPQARFTAIPGGHNDWSEQLQVKIRR